MTNLAVITAGFALALFIASQVARRSPPEKRWLHMLVNGLRAVVLGLVLIYFYQRFVA